jgi:hypothetical protein
LKKKFYKNLSAAGRRQIGFPGLIIELLPIIQGFVTDMI